MVGPVGLVACHGPAAAEKAQRQVAAEAQRGGHAAAAPRPADRTARPAASAPEPSLGVADVGIFSDLDAEVALALPASLTADQVHAVVDPRHQLLVLYRDDQPLKVYPLGRGDALVVGGEELRLRPGDRAELAPLLRDDALARLAEGATAAPGDRDGDGIPDPLDVLLGARKNVLNGAVYTEGYETLRYPGGDVDRSRGVCTDVVIRAVRNAGLDLQVELHDDLRRAPRSYPMVTRPNASIDQRRVKTLLPYFVRHWTPHTTALDDATDPYRPGDVVFFDTFPSKSGPDHIGIVSDTVGPSGHLVIVNAWTDGMHTNEMDLLAFVPVTHRFRIPSR